MIGNDDDEYTTKDGYFKGKQHFLMIRGRERMQDILSKER